MFSFCCIWNCSRLLSCKWTKCYNPDTGNQAYKFSTSAESIDESVYADYIQNLYAKPVLLTETLVLFINSGK